MRAILAAAFALFSLSLLACGGGGNRSPTPAATARGTAAAPLSIEAANARRSGIHQIDSVLAAIEAHDVDLVISHIQMTPMPCRATHVPETVDIACPSGAADSTPTNAFLYSACEGTLVGTQEAQSRMRTFLGGLIERSHLYAVYPAGARLVQGWAAVAKANQVIIETIDDSQQAWELLIGNEGIVGLFTGCQVSAGDFVDLWHLQGAIIPPLILPPDTARRTGIAQVDAIIDAVLSGDNDRLLSLIEFQKIACAEESQGIGSPPLCSDYGVSSGTQLEVLHASQCEDYYIVRKDFTAIRPDGMGIYAVNRDGDGYAILFSITATNGDRTGLVYSVRDGKIVGIHAGCDESLYDMAARVEPGTFVLPPPQ